MPDNENVNKVMYFLDRVKVNPVKEAHEQQIDTPTTLNIRNYNFTLNAWHLFLCAFVVMLAVIGAISLISYFLPHKALPVITAPHITNQITVIEADNYKNVVHAVARCENKHYNTIYAELRKKFNYVRYRDLDRETYEKALMYLKPRLCMNQTQQ